MSEIVFRKPDIKDKDTTLVFRKRFLSVHHNRAIDGGSELASFSDKGNGYIGWLGYINAPAGTNLFGYCTVPSDTYIALINDVMVGVVNLRYELDEFLSKIGGHVGYSTHPDYEGQGVASAMLGFACAQLRKHGVVSALITCKDDNIASAKVIEKNGGVFSNVLMMNDIAVRRYFIDL